MGFYKQHKDELLLYDYLYERYNIDYTVCILELNREIWKDINIKKLLRKSDKCIKISGNQYFILFFATNKPKTFEALHALEKNILTIYNFFHLTNVFKAFVMEKTKDRTVKDIIKTCFRMSKVRNQKNTGYIITKEDCFGNF